MRPLPLARIALPLLLILVLPRPGSATWPRVQNVNLPVCLLAGDQYNPTAATDGAGGMFVCWQDKRNFGSTGIDLYMTHITRAGTLDPAWPANGLPVCALAGDQGAQVMIADGAGGTIVAWHDYRAGYASIYASRYTATGALAPGWATNGVHLSFSAGDEYGPQICTDGLGGAFVAWTKAYSGSDYDPYVTRITAAGTIPLGFLPGGIDLDSPLSVQDQPAITEDGAGGAIVAWESNALGSYDIRAARVGASATLAWSMTLCNAAGDQRNPFLAADGVAGAYIEWNDHRGADWDIYAHHVLASGVPSLSFLSNGSPLASGVFDQFSMPPIPDGLGGAYFGWTDAGGIFGSAVATHYLPSGSVPSGWGSGLYLNSSSAILVSDGAGGLLAADGGFELFTLVTGAQRLAGDASPPVGWGGAHWAWTTSTGSYGGLGACTDGTNGILLAWSDNRASVDLDIYAQRIERFGYLGDPAPVLASVKDVKNDQGGQVRVAWNASYLDADPAYGIYAYRVWRQAPVAAAQAALAHGATLFDERTAAPAARAATGEIAPAADPAVAGDGRPTFRTTIEAGQTIYWELVGTQTASGYPGYSLVVATTGDSIGSGNPYTTFMVDAVGYGYGYWASPPDSAYSVDNLPPVAPAPFTGTWTAGTGTSLFWSANAEADLAGYRLYRGGSPSFVPGPSNLVVQKTSPGFLDAGAPAACYKLSAIDVHGNESAFSLLVPSGTLAVDNAAPTELALAPIAPNPARANARLEYALPRTGRVALALFDAQGRRVRTLLDGVLPAGRGSVAWDGRDQGGAAVGSGLYFVRLEMEGRVLARRMAYVR